MNRIVLLAPGAVPPWTEGRKIFVTDLAAELRLRGVIVHLLDGAPTASPMRMILNTLCQLDELCSGPDTVDAVIAFPYGTFHGLRGRANSWLLRRTRTICKKFGVMHIPVFYSCVGLDLNQLGHRFGPALAVGGSGPRIAPIHLGIRHPSYTWHPLGNGLQRLLFLCGYQRPTTRSLHDVLYERGLADLFDAVNMLSSDNICLTIAIPFLRDARMRERLGAEIVRRCPATHVKLESEVDPYMLFQSHDVFAFPYRCQHAVFVPTSLLEAMSIGIPVIAADHAMYRALTVAKAGDRCGLHREGDPMDFVRTLQNMRQNYDVAVERAHAVSVEVREEWTVERAVDELCVAISAAE